jgi:hypothetical protein
MKEIEKAIAAVKLAELSLHPEKAPKYTKETIEAEREKASQGLLIALDLLKQLEGAGK